MQTRVTDQPAFILHRRDWRNSSLLLDILTLDYGRVNLLAKGGKNSRSRGLYQPFCKLSVSWTGRQELKTLTGIDGYPAQLPEALFLPLLYVNELIEAFLPKFEASAEIFLLYEALLNNINSDNCEIMLREFERSSMKNLGYLPDIQTDADLGKVIDPDASYQFRANSGFVPCSSGSANAIDGRFIDLWNQGIYDELAVRHLSKTVMRCIIDFNLQGKRLKSREIYLQMKNWV